MRTKTRRDEIAEEIFEHLDKKLSAETKSKLSSYDTREIVYSLSDYVLIENFNTIFDHLEKFQKAILEADEEEVIESDFIEELKKV
jgi:hypothetical protein